MWPDLGAKFSDEAFRQLHEKDCLAELEVLHLQGEGAVGGGFFSFSIFISFFVAQVLAMVSPISAFNTYARVDAVLACGYFVSAVSCSPPFLRSALRGQRF